MAERATTVPKSLRLKPLSYAMQPETPGGKHLEKFTLISQTPQSNWCWAANSNAISAFYGTGIDKCRVVTLVLSKANSCPWEDAFGKGSLGKDKDGNDVQCCKDLWPLDAKADPCVSQQADNSTNKRGRVVCGLLAVKHYSAFRDFETDPFDIKKVSEQIDGSRPLIMQVRWEGGGQHYVSITGYDDKQNLNIADPMSDALAWEDGHWTTMHIGDEGDQYYAPEGGWGTWIATGLTAKRQ